MEIETRRIYRGIIIVVSVAILFYLLLLLFTTSEEVYLALSRFPWTYLPLVLLLVSVNYVIRTGRWKYYLDSLGIRLTFRQSMSIFFAGLSMTVTPAKIGEALKSVLLQAKFGTQYRMSLPAVVMERVTDVTGMLILIGLSSFGFAYGLASMLIVATVVIFLLTSLRYMALSFMIVRMVSRIKYLRKHAGSIHDAFSYARALSGWKILSFSTIISTGAWMLECMAFLLITIGLGLELSLSQAVFIYSFSSLFGAVSFLPGGLGAAEGSMLGLLVISGVDVANASVAVLLARLSTLWFALVVGLISLQLWMRRA